MTSSPKNKTPMNLSELGKKAGAQNYFGIGYLKHVARTAKSDEALLAAASDQQLSEDELLLWASSKTAREVMDSVFSLEAARRATPTTLQALFSRSLEQSLDDLKAEKDSGH